MKEDSVRFFLGSPTRRGFVPLFEELRRPEDKCLYILKGGAGSGKSTLMKRVGAALEELGDAVEYICCASDPDSLDAVIDADRGVAMVDGTPPHVVEAKYPGAYERVIDTGQAWDAAALRRDKAEIIRLSETISAQHAEAAVYVKAAGDMLAWVRKAAGAYVDEPAVCKAADSLLPPAPPSDTFGRESRRLLGAVSVGEVKFLSGTLSALCDEVCSVQDPYGASSDRLLSLIRQRALSQGRRVISCYSADTTPDKLDHLILPENRVGFTTENRFHSFAGDRRLGGLYRSIPADEMSDWNAMEECAAGLLDNACRKVGEAKALHDALEAIYAGRMDFSRLDEMYRQILDEILSF